MWKGRLMTSLGGGMMVGVEERVKLVSWKSMR
jgi:hypothetical protein